MTSSRQQRVAAWARRVLGFDRFILWPERGLRVLEEAAELAQAMGVRVDEAHALISYVFERPKGEIHQEIGGVCVTLAAASSAAGIDVDVAYDQELGRIHQPEVEAKVRRRQSEKRAVGAAEINSARWSLQAMVEEFHRVGGYPIRREPTVHLPRDEVRFRLRLIAEEFFEQFDAIFHGTLQRQLLDDAKAKLRQVIEIGPIIGISLPNLVDAWADLLYVVVGSNVTFGVDGDAVFRVVHEANMRKFGPGAARDPATGKPIKPPGWVPPDIAGELERQIGAPK